MKSVKGELCLVDKSEAKLNAGSFRRYDFIYECFHIVFVFLNLNLVNIISQNFLENYYQLS